MVLRATIKGRVQGVGFRYWVLKTAQDNLLNGWVRNSDDGNVELEAEGDEDTLNEFEQQLWRGPAFSRVTAVDAEYADEKPQHRGFEITY